MKAKNSKPDSYNVFSSKVPTPPTSVKGVEFVDFIGSPTTKTMRSALLPLSLTAISSYVSGVQFVYCDNKCYELCG